MEVDELEGRKKRVFDAVNEEDGLLSTNQVREKAGVHYYRAENILEEMNREGLVEKIPTSTVTMWKVADGV